ncbi:TonB-dependent receptor [Marinobacter sp.]|uniref:TonB-dependent receptor n=1 Tax=Marinobacter sp. TaxID=50741 RepID=UPI00384F85E9
MRFPRSGILLLTLMPLLASAKELPFITVEAPLINAASEADPSNSTGPVRIIERADFDNRTVTLADTLSEQTGVQIRQSGGLGSYASVSMRGSTSQQVQVVVDGMLLNDPVTGGVDVSQLALHDISRIQVYPGSAPVQFAHSGIGGVVVMETLGRDLEDTTRVSLGAGSFDTYKAGLFNSGSHGRFYYWLSGNHQTSNNDFSYPNRADWFNPNDGETTKRRNAGYEQDDASAKLGWQLNDTSQVDALIQWSDQERGVPSIQNWRSNEAELTTESLRSQLHYRQQGWLDGQLHSSHRLVWSDSDQRYDNRSGLVGIKKVDVRTDIRELGLINTLSLLLGSHTLTATVDTTNYDYTQEDILDNESEDQRDRLMISSALSHQWLSPGGSWRTRASVRRFDVRDESDEVQPDGAVTREGLDSSWYSWDLGLSHYFADYWTISGNLGRQVRIPTLQETFGQQGLFVGNPELEPEESLNTDLTLRTDRSWGYLEATGFYRDLNPAIAPLYDARGIGRFINLEAITYGTELEASVRLTSYWRLLANALLQESENQSDKVRDREGKRLPGIYHESAMIKSIWEVRPFSFSLSYHHDDELFYDASNQLAAEARQIVNASATWSRVWPNRHESVITLEARNLTDEIYQDFNRFPGPGRSLFLNLKHSF